MTMALRALNRSSASGVGPALPRSVAAALATLVLVASAWGVERFPPPDFGPGYSFPASSQTAPRAGWMAWLDMAVLLGALVMAALIAHRWRSRRMMLWLTVFSLLYFGFYRKGCVCPIGAIQNVSQAIFDPTHATPFVVLFFFTAPLAFALLVGRVFCGGVCPLGAMQDLALIREVRVPRRLEDGLGLLRHFYLGAAVLFAATGAGYLICRYDPFVSFFRFSGRFHIWVWSAAILGLSTFIGRPYCRFLCPYGAVLGLLSRFSWKRVTIAPDRCVVCSLCRDACPFGAIRPAEEEEEAAR